MRNPNFHSRGMSHLGTRVTILAALLAAFMLLLGTISDAEATHGGTFNFTTTAQAVDEGDTAQLEVVISNRDTSEVVNLTVSRTLITAESEDIGGITTSCFVVSGLVSNPFFIPIGTVVDADEEDETFSVTLSINGAGCAEDHAVVGGPETITITINDTSAGGTPTFNFQSASSQRAESAAAESIVVARTGSLAEEERVDCVVTGGTATLGVDYTFVAQELVFAPGDPEVSCAFSIIDNNDTTNETIIFSLQDPSAGTQVGATSTHTVTILDSDVQTVQFSEATYSRNENGGVATFVVTRNNPEGTVTVDCTPGETGSGAGHADAGVDMSSSTTEITFDGGSTSELCSVPITNDQVTEGPETFRLTLSGVTGTLAELGPNDEAIVTIVDDEVATTYKFSATNYDVGEGAGTVTITVERSVTTGTGSVQWDLSNGTATAGQDYTDASGTVTFAAGEGSKTFTVTILQDQSAEGNQTINMTLLTPVNGTLGTPSTATITILDDEGIPTITGVAPGTISTAGGASVVITGTNFTGTTAVKFGGTNATSFVVNNATQITAVAPAKAAGTYDITVTNAVGTNVNTAADNITYQALTTITYTLTKTWTLLAWLGKDNIQIQAAFQGQESPDVPQTNNVLSVVTAVAQWDAPNQKYLFWFPGGASVPGANDITTFRFGTAYWVAVSATTNWTVIQGP